MSDDQFEASVNRKIEPISARNGAGSVCIVPRIWLVDGRDDEFEQGLAPGRDERQPPGRQRRAEAEHRDDRPGHDDRLGDPDRADVKQRLEGQRRLHASLR